MVTNNYSEYLRKKEEIIKNLKGDLGCVLEFHGFVRNYHLKKGKKVQCSGLEIKEDVPEILEDVVDKAKKSFQVIEVLVYHNTGFLKVGERISAISVFAKHRKEAFLALEFLIKEMKKHH